MAKAKFELPNGTVITVDGTADEIEPLLRFYTEKNQQHGPAKAKSPQAKSSKPNSKPAASKQDTKQSKAFVGEIVNLIHSCDDAENMAKNILDKRDILNRILLPLHIIHHFDIGISGMSTKEIESTTKEFGALVDKSDVRKKLVGSGRKYVVTDVNIPRGAGKLYSLNRRGLAHMESVIRGEKSS